MFSSTGILKYGQDKLILEIDKDLSNYYRLSIPKYYKINPQKYPPHISVVRKEIPPNMNFWGKYENELIQFHYDHHVYNDNIYFWLNVFCLRLEDIRVELGLPINSKYTLPPDGFTKCFHATIGNIKQI